jgi:2-haloacid dehalogenase
MAIRAITFDCYGTLVDWEAGLQAWAAKIIAKRGYDRLTPDEFVQKWEQQQLAMLTPYRGYRDIVARAAERVLRELKLTIHPDDPPSLADAIPTWRPFPDVPEALRRLGQRYKLGIISNMDNVVLFESIARLGAPIHMRTSAEDAKAYKPDPRPFELALSRLGIPAGEVLHAAFGWKYDLKPARELGMQTAFVDRGGGKPEGYEADIEVKSVAELADRLLAG